MENNVKIGDQKIILQQFIQHRIYAKWFRLGKRSWLWGGGRLKRDDKKCMTMILNFGIEKTNIYLKAPIYWGSQTVV